MGRGEVGGLAAEGDGKTVEVGLVVVVEKFLVEELVQACIGKEAVAQGDAVFQADSDAVGEIPVFLTAAVIEVGVTGAEAEDAADLVAGEDVAHLLGGVAGGVERGEDGTHGGAGDDVDGDVVLFKPLDGADLGEGDGGASAEGKTDNRAVFRNICWRYGGVGGGQAKFRGGGGILLCGAGRFGRRSAVFSILLLALRGVFAAGSGLLASGLLGFPANLLGGLLTGDNRAGRGRLSVHPNAETRQGCREENRGDREREASFQQR